MLTLEFQLRTFNRRILHTIYSFLHNMGLAVNLVTIRAHGGWNDRNIRIKFKKCVEKCAAMVLILSR